ncbi:hypothetical protein J6590_003830 [Homalodisca vitripennis]|nr:hypothetical protein J6590_003830 [Homalodisca vitripennis]
MFRSPLRPKKQIRLGHGLRPEGLGLIPGENDAFNMIAGGKGVPATNQSMQEDMACACHQSPSSLDRNFEIVGFLGVTISFTNAWQIE